MKTLKDKIAGLMLNAISVTITNMTGGTLDFVTNGVATTVDNEKFIRLKIEQ